MLFARAQERRSREAAESLERITLAVNNGLVITRDKAAREQFERGRRNRSGTAPEPEQTPAQFRATLGRLGAMFPAAVKVH